ncbi:hypothetical protein D3C76_1541430 [compost metagenome]
MCSLAASASMSLLARATCWLLLCVWYSDRPISKPTTNTRQRPASRVILLWIVRNLLCMGKAFFHGGSGCATAPA